MPPLEETHDETLCFSYAPTGVSWMCEEYTFSRGSPPGRIFHHETTFHRACLVRRRAAAPARAAAALHRRRGDDPFDARRDGAGPHHVARDRPAVPHAH